MAIIIDNPEAEDLLAQLNATTGKSATELVVELLRREADRLRRARDIDARRREIEEISKAYAAKLPPNPQTPDEIIGYDENGLPR
jgi:antitoxin VapB